jgi:hypothetical protein
MTIKLNLPSGQAATVKLYGTDGRLTQEQQIHSQGKPMNVNLGDLNTGTYKVAIANDNMRYTKVLKVV